MKSRSLKETKAAAGDFIKNISGVKNSRALVVGLFGDLGSGKTTFTQAVGEHLGVSEVMTSPTFVIQKRYKIGKDKKTKLSATNLIHIDAYRLESGRELISLGFAEIIKDPKNLIIIEWPERVAEVLPKDLIKLGFNFVSENEREINML